MVGYDPTKSKILTSLDYTLAGSISGFTTRALCQPLDVVKIRFQLQVEPISRKTVSSKYKSLIQCFNCIIKEEGLPALWKGHVPAQYLSVIYGSVQFCSYEMATSLVYANLNNQSLDKFWINFSCGAFAGAMASTVSMPFDVIRTRLVAQGEPKIIPSFRQAFIYIGRREGLASFYRGLTPALIQILPHTGFQFSFNRLANQLWCLYLPSSLSSSSSSSSFSFPSAAQSFLCGGFAGVAAKCLVYPLDLTKKRLQIQGFAEARKNFGVTPTYHGFVDCLFTIFRQESALGLFKGLSPSLLKAFLTTALHFLFYEQSLKALICLKNKPEI